MRRKQFVNWSRKIDSIATLDCCLMPLRATGLLCLMSFCLVANAGEPAHYAGADVCAVCHGEIAATQTKTRMANTWHGRNTPLLPLNYDGRVTEATNAPVRYEVHRLPEKLLFSVVAPNAGEVTLPVEMMVGGTRHGLSFLPRIEELAGVSLIRPALIEARYVYSPSEKRLVLSPGFATTEPATYETAFGSVLSRSFEAKCLTCHGKPNTLGAGKQGGVRCESCHGPGSQHIQAISGGSPGRGIINPKRLRAEKGMEICAQCHTGFALVSDPLPDDLLISNQVTALRNSECFIQSAGHLTCTNCHNPHDDSKVSEASLRTCLGCHSTAAEKRAAICPVNAKANCTGCHMPAVQKGSFHLVDHWIRVHPEQRVSAPSHDSSLASQVPPLREFIRIVVTTNRTQAETAVERLRKGESFSSVARDVSIDTSAQVGGYVGEMVLSQMDPKLTSVAAALRYGEDSGIIEMSNRFMIIGRLPRDFKWQADQLHEQASALKARGEVSGAIEKERQALSIYPYFLRALISIGATLGESGDAQNAATILQFASTRYPNDADAAFNFGLTLGGLGRHSEEIQAYRRAIEIQPDFAAAYENLGAALYSSGDWKGAVEICRRGLDVDPLSALLYYDLGIALKQHGDDSEAKRWLTLAMKIDPRLSSRVQK